MRTDHTPMLAPCHHLCLCMRLSEGHGLRQYASEGSRCAIELLHDTAQNLITRAQAPRALLFLPSMCRPFRFPIGVATHLHVPLAAYSV